MPKGMKKKRTLAIVQNNGIITAVSVRAPCRQKAFGFTLCKFMAELVLLYV